MWYVVQTISGEEQKCLEVCERKLDTSSYNKMFIPKYIAKIHYQKQWHNRLNRLFPGYFFIDTEQIDTVSAALQDVQRFTKVLRNAETIAPITKEEQSFLESMMDEDYIVRYSEGFLIGDKVYITEGPLRNQSGLIYKIDRHRRLAYLRINLFGRETPVEVGFSAVAKLTEEEFSDIKQHNIEFYNQEDTLDLENQVKVLSGVFEGMTGMLLCVDEKRDEYTVLMELFGSEPSRVVFHKNDIQIM